jgi:hypothetical protein
VEAFGFEVASSNFRGEETQREKPAQSFFTRARVSAILNLVVVEWKSMAINLKVITN